MSQLSNEVYETIQKKIQYIVNHLAQQKGEGKLAEDVSIAYKNLMILNDEIQDEFSKLRESGEWKRFTIAFYGETNAGKSTLIETLRLLFKEPLKVEQQQRFKQLQQQSGLTQEAFDRIRQLILKLEDQVNISKEALADLKKQHLQNSTQADDEVKALENLVSEIKS